MNRTVAILAGVGTVLTVTLAGCEGGVAIPEDPNTCFHLAQQNGETQFNALARDQPSIEYCAARLEEMRVNFLRLGGSTQEITGAYNGQYIFIDRAGIWLSQSLEGGRFFFLARTGDGRLAIPGVIQRSTQVEASSPQG